MSLSFATPGRALIPGGVGLCALIWGTTWYGITFQLGHADPAVSVVMRFALAGLILAGVTKATGGRLLLTRAQNIAVACQGVFAFSISYAFTYASELTVPSAVVAVIFAALAFLNLALFRLLSNQKAARAAWGGAVLGLFGVGVLSAGQIAQAGFGAGAATGVGFATIAVTASAFGNWFAWRGQQAGASILAGTAWAMMYGAAILGVWTLVTGVSWAIDWTPSYVLSLAYLTVFGSVIAFGVYFAVARARGYALASYISALTPPIAMLVSVLFEGARFGWTAGLGLILVLAGQLLLIRSPKRSAAA